MSKVQSNFSSQTAPILNISALHQVAHRKKVSVINKCSGPDNPFMLMYQHDKSVFQVINKEENAVNIFVEFFFFFYW